VEASERGRGVGGVGGGWGMKGGGEGGGGGARGGEVIRRGERGKSKEKWRRVGVGEGKEGKRGVLSSRRRLSKELIGRSSPLFIPKSKGCKVDSPEEETARVDDPGVTFTTEPPASSGAN